MRSSSTRSVALALLLALAGCAPGEGCVDRDLDGFGDGCEAGPDCDDTNAARGLDCDAVPPPDCALDPSATGCPCLVGSVTDCFPGSPVLAGVGECAPGRARCVAGRWGLCDGARPPASERCDMRDQDCDGRVDEGTLSPCGGCDTRCTGTVWGDPFVAPHDDFAVTASGQLTLARRERVATQLWLANTADGTASRIDADAAREVGRYATGPLGEALEPSRVAVDWNGDAWIANRAFDGTSSVVRIAGSRARCVDADDDGVVRTSEGSLVLPWGDDECVTLRVPVGGPREVARAIAIDGNRGLDGVSGGNVWVGLHDGQAFVELDGLDGAERRRVPTPGFSPYAAVFDPWGTLWAIDRDGHLVRIDPRAEPPHVEMREVPLSCWLLYGLSADDEGRLAMTGFSCDRVTLYDPQTDRFQSVAVPPSPRGAVFTGDELWVAHTTGDVSRLGSAPLRLLATRSLASGEVMPIEAIGIGSAGPWVWTVSSSGGANGGGLATRIERATSRVDTHVEVGQAPHTQGDLSGVELRGAFVPEASAERIFEGCGTAPTVWRAVHLAAEAGALGRVRLELRHAADREALEGATWIALGELPGSRGPFPLELPEGGVVELRLTLRVEGASGAPRVQRVGLEWSCPGPI